MRTSRLTVPAAAAMFAGPATAAARHATPVPDAQAPQADG